MKSIARSFFFRAKINRDIEDIAINCKKTFNKHKQPIKIWAEEPFSRLYTDCWGPFLNKYFLIVLDAHTKWLEVFPTTNIASSFTIKALHSPIARFGVVSDNATNFTSSEFKTFLQKFEIKNILCIFSTVEWSS